MGLFGSDSKNVQKSYTTNLVQDITKSYGDYSEVDGDQTKAIIDAAEGSSVSLSMLDGGAINKAFSFASNALTSAISASTSSQQETLQYTNNLLEGVLSSTNSEASNVTLNAMKWGVIAIGIISAAWMVGKMGKKWA